jgi:CBS domain-containing protein
VSPNPDDNHLSDESYFDQAQGFRERVFDTVLLRRPLSVLPARSPLVFAPSASVAEATRAMQKEHRGCVLVTEDGTPQSRLIGIFTERDILFRIVDRGRNPATLPLREVMTLEPECLLLGATVAHVLNQMSVGGFRHVPVVDEQGRPAFVISVRDVVELLVASFPREVLNLPTGPGAGRTRTREGA